MKQFFHAVNGMRTIALGFHTKLTQFQSRQTRNETKVLLWVKYLLARIYFVMLNRWLIRCSSVIRDTLLEGCVLTFISGVSNQGTSPLFQHLAMSYKWECGTAQLTLMKQRMLKLCHDIHDMYTATPWSAVEEKSPTLHVTDPGKRQVICSTVHKLSWNSNGKMSMAPHTNPIISKAEHSPFHVGVS